MYILCILQCILTVFIERRTEELKIVNIDNVGLFRRTQFALLFHFNFFKISLLIFTLFIIIFHRTNKYDWPIELSTAVMEHLPVGSCRHAFYGPLTAIAYVGNKSGDNNKKKVIHLLSTVHHDVVISECLGVRNSKPAPILLYNMIKVGDFHGRWRNFPFCQLKVRKNEIWICCPDFRTIFCESLRIFSFLTTLFLSLCHPLPILGLGR
jgi:hypothetical protein